MKPRLHVSIDRVILVWNRERELLSRGNVHVDERAGNAKMPEAAPEVAVAEQLSPIAFETVARQSKPFGGEVCALEFLDQPVPFRSLHAAVESSGQHGRPVLHRDTRLEMDFAAVVSVRFPPRREHPRVKLGA